MNDKKIKLFELVNLYRLESSNVFLNIPTNKIVDFVDMVFEAYENEQTIFACGNGGNVASVQNLVVDMNMLIMQADVIFHHFPIRDIIDQILDLV